MYEYMNVHQRYSLNLLMDNRQDILHSNKNKKHDFRNRNEIL
jgi:hypothetical protein